MNTEETSAAAPPNAVPIEPLTTTPTEPTQLSPPACLVVQPPPEAPLRINAALGSLAVLPEADQVQLITLELTIEDSVGRGWKAFVDIGQALVAIKEKILYRAEFSSFEDYCRVKWDFQHSKANYMMAAARVVKSLATLQNVPLPQRESPLRPLHKLAPEDAQRAWKLAVERTGGRRITARVVKNAVQSLNLGGEPSEKASPQGERVDQHRLISDCFGELLKLLSQRADYQLVTEKVEELHGHVERLFRKRAAGP